MAYRGRVLLELTTKLADKPEHKSDDIPSDDLLVVEVRRCDESSYSRRQQTSTSSLFLIFSTEISQEKEVLPLCGVLLRHAPTGRRRCHPV